MLLLPIILLFLLIATVISVFGYIRFVRPANMLDRLSTSFSAEAADTLTNPEALEGKSAVGFAKMLESFGRLLPYSPRDLDSVRRELGKAGIRSVYGAYAYLGIKILACASLLIVGLTVRGYLAESPVNRLIVPIACAVGGFLAPGFVLGRLISSRQRKIRVALPDVLDLLVISTEAGCALDKALVNVSREFSKFHPALSEELTMVNMEMLAGGSRMDALRNFATRTGEEELKKLVAILIQTDRFGTSVADALRTQSDFLRVRRRQIAEEKAGKVGVKLVFPIFFFCMPALMIIVAGPGMLQLFKNLLPALGSI
jgi:tight adherence protein C